jgi:hypothetical protein
MKRLLLVLALSTLSLSAFGQTYYAEAKFVCGRAGQPEIDAFAFAPGVYYTSINVGNPNDDKIDSYKKIFSIALLRQKAGKVSHSIGWSLQSRESMQVDCSDIYGYLGVAPGTFIDGFVYFLGGPLRYTVTGVYTLTDGGRPVSQDVEEVTVRRQ